MTLNRTFVTLYSLLIRIGQALQSPLLLVVRLYWGWQFMQTGWGKLHNIDHVIQFFGSLGIPAPAANAWFVSSLELIGGFLLIIGLGSRLIAFLLTGDMFVAYLTADREALLSFFSDPGKFYGATTYTFFFASSLIFVFGPGKFSVDHFLTKWFEKQAIAVKSQAHVRS